MSIETIAIIGAGAQGRAIAQITLQAGYRVVLEDFSIRTLEEAEASISIVLAKQEGLSVQLRPQTSDATKQTSTEALADDMLSSLSTCVGIEDAIRNAHLIIETAADELETKLELFTIFDKFARPDAIFVTTSDAHAIAEIADITVCPERCVTLRFTPSDNPTRVALIPGRQTSAHALARCSEFAQRLKLEATLAPPSCSEE
jgi:3-hydroxybutyryl-CoA dehydrogenase